MNFLIDALISFLFVLPAIIVHEVSHGWVAYLLGDTTAKDRGRLSLNPIVHIDTFGTVILPIMLLLVSRGSFTFGYAKPVPINPYRMRDYRVRMLLTGLAGPVSNLLLASLAGIVVRVLVATEAAGAAAEFIATGAFTFVYLNLVLMFFNLIPLPPLDGSRVLPMFLSDRAMRTYAEMERYGMLILFLLVFLLPSFLPFDPISEYLRFTAQPLLRLLTGVG